MFKVFRKGKLEKSLLNETEMFNSSIQLVARPEIKGDYLANLCGYDSQCKAAKFILPKWESSYL